MIAYRDFRTPAALTRGILSGYEKEAVERANDWIALERVDVISAETLPERRGIRVWYRAEPRASGSTLPKAATGATPSIDRED